MRAFSELLIPIGCLSVILLAGCDRVEYSKLGVPEDPVRIAIQDSKGAPELAQALNNFFAGSLKVVAEVKGTVEIVEGFGPGTVHVAFMNTLGYVLAHEWTLAEAKLRLKYSNGKTDYSGGIIALKGGRVRVPEDINGRVLAFKDRYATTGHLLAVNYLRKSNIVPATTVFAGSYRDVALGVYEGRFDAGAIYFGKPGPRGVSMDSRIEILDLHPDALEKLVLIADTGNVPSGPVVINRRLPPEMKMELIEALLRFSVTAPAKKALLNAYDATALIPATDADFASVRADLAATGMNPEDFVEKGYKFTMRRAMQNQHD
ncbi:MAG: PhnD/SsuA/transferrin family substrate-binding protein [Leptospirales bacterium]|nr:PhnD/SsuA/transferrin family substrate-binding protein [Leptospirales bacterium]